MSRALIIVSERCAAPLIGLFVRSSVQRDQSDCLFGAVCSATNRIVCSEQCAAPPIGLFGLLFFFPYVVDCLQIQTFYSFNWKTL